MLVTIDAKTVRRLTKTATYCDNRLFGFHVRVNAGRRRTTKTYRFVYGRGKRGRAGVVTIGKDGDPWRVDETTGVVIKLDADRARAEAEILRGHVNQGQDPAARGSRSDAFGPFATALVEGAEISAKTRANYLSVLQTHILSADAPGGGLATRPIRSITADDVLTLLYSQGGNDGTLGKPRTQSAETLKVLRVIFNKAKSLRMITTNPCEGIKRPTKRVQRQTILTHDEIRKVWKAAESDHVYGRGVRLGLVCPLRRGEVFAAPRAEIDADAKLWRIPAKRRKGKFGDLNLPLTSDALALIDEVKRHTGKRSAFLFPGKHASTDGRDYPLSTFSDSWRRLLIRAGIITEAQATADAAAEAAARAAGIDVDSDDADENPADASPWLPIRFHDIRRTVRNAMTAELGIDTHVAEACIGHVLTRNIATYAPGGIAGKAMRRAMEKWTAHLRKILAGGEKKAPRSKAKAKARPKTMKAGAKRAA